LGVRGKEISQSSLLVVVLLLTSCCAFRFLVGTPQTTAQRLARDFFRLHVGSNAQEGGVTWLARLGEFEIAVGNDSTNGYFSLETFTNPYNKWNEPRVKR
jgi:hypothetical protein